MGERRAAALVSSVVCCLGLAAMPAGASAESPPDPPGTVQVTPASAGRLRDAVSVLAASPHYAVLSLVHRYLATTPPAGNDATLIARAADGTLTTLAGTGDEDSRFEPDASSLVGGTLSTDDDPSGRLVHWWDVPAGTHGAVTLAPGQHYLSGAPDGFLYESGDHVYRRSTGGTVTDLGVPFAGSRNLVATSGDAGMVVTDFDPAQPDGMVYRSFTDPSGFTPLRVPAGNVGCVTVVGDYAGCYATDPAEAVLLPLDGVRPATVVAGGASAGVAVVGSRLLWQSGPRHQLHSVGYGSTVVRTSPVARGYGLDSAYGAALVAGADNASLQRVTSATGPAATVYTAGYSPVAATALSLSPGRLVDDDDRRIRGSSALSSTVSTAVTTSSPALRVGATGLVHADTVPVPVLGSGTTTVYVVGDTRDTTTRVVRTPTGSRTITGTLGDRFFSTAEDASRLSGNRFVYAGTTRRGQQVAYLYDASTGRRTVLQRLGAALPAVFGDEVALLHPDGSVWRRDLVTGASVQLLPPTPFVGYGQLFAWGDHVGWNLVTGDEDEGIPGGEVSGFRDARTMAPARVLSVPVQQLSSAGAVLRTDDPSGEGRAQSYALETYAGVSVPLLPLGRYAVGPQVEGRTMAWVDGTGVVKVAPVAVSPAAPRFLGAPLAPALIRSPGRARWRAYAPFSAPLTTCRVDVLRGARVVRRLACDPARMRVGVAEFAWDGTYSGRPAPAGTYRWRIVSAGDGGASLDAAGDRQPVVHVLGVGRPTRVALRAPARVGRDGAAVLSAHLTTLPRSHDRHRPVSVFRRLAGGAWHRVATVRTDAVGTARLRVRPAATSAYRASFTGSRVDRPSTSRVVVVRVG